MGHLFDAVGHSDGLGRIAHTQHEERKLTLTHEGEFLRRLHPATAVVVVIGLAGNAVALSDGEHIEVETAGEECSEWRSG